MSKNNTRSTLVEASLQAENLVVKKDLIQTVIVNLLFIAVLIGLHYWNQSHGTPLDKFISQLIKL